MGTGRQVVFSCSASQQHKTWASNLMIRRGGGEAPAADSTQGDICQYLLEVWVISTGKRCWQNWAGRVNAAQRFRAVAALLATDYDPA